MSRARDLANFVSTADADLEIATSASDTGVDLVLDGNKSSNGGVGSIIFNNAGDSVGMIRSNRASANDAADMLFYTQATGGANSERMRILSDGGLTFNGDTAAANALDDYEEGSWTPAMNSGGSTLGIIADSAIYTKIGRFVHVQVYANSLASTTSSGFRISGLPFTNISSGQTSGSIMYQNVDIPGSRTQLVAYAPSSQDVIRIYAEGDSITWQEVTGTNTGTSFNMIINVQYTTST